MTGDEPPARTPSEKRAAVRDRYGAIGASDGAETGSTAAAEDSCCGGSGGETSCCGGGESELTETLGYDPDRAAAVPDGADLGLGCGNPGAIADLDAGETVLDLGSGGGFDCFLAAREVGPAGRVIGVDMTPTMIQRARRNARRDDTDHVEFRLGEIEHLPVADGTVDVVISNCVINLSTAKERVFQEVYRVLNPGGRLAISDIAMTERGREELDRTDLEQYASCVAGAATVDRLRDMLDRAGFESVTVRPKEDSETIIDEMYDGEDVTALLDSVVIRGRKPQ